MTGFPLRFRAQMRMQKQLSGSKGQREDGMDIKRATAARRSQSYWLLSRLFLEEVDQQMLEQLSSALRAAQGCGDAGEVVALQAAVRTALASPRQMSNLRVELTRILRDLVPQAASPDHVGTELRLMSILCFSEMQAWRAGSEREARKVLRQELTFLDQHVLPWVPGFCARLAELTTHPFCLALAAITTFGCRKDRDDVESFIRGKDTVLLARAATACAA